MKKFLFSILFIISILRCFADPTPLIKQFKISDSGNNVWILTATAIDGKFPSNALIIDGYCSSFYIKGSEPQQLTFDLYSNSISAVQYPTSLIQGFISVQVDPELVSTLIMANPQISNLILYVNSRMIKGQYVPMSFHIIYQ